MDHFYVKYFIATVFVPTVLEAVLEAARQKTQAVPYLNHNAWNIGCFFFFDRFNAPLNSSNFGSSVFRWLLYMLFPLAN